jgi:hypothetical protein
LHYRGLPILGKMVTGLPQLRTKHDGICRGCALGTNAKGSFSSSDSRSKGILDFVHSYLCGPMTIASLSGSSLMDETVAVTVTSWLQRQVGHLRIFGCPVYIHVPKQKRTKLDLSAKKGTSVGYRESSKAYQIYIPGQRQIEVSRDVSFEKEVAFRRSKGSC